MPWATTSCTRTRTVKTPTRRGTTNVERKTGHDRAPTAVWTPSVPLPGTGIPALALLPVVDLSHVRVSFSHRTVGAPYYTGRRRHDRPHSARIGAARTRTSYGANETRR